MVRYKLVKHKWPDEIEAERKRRNQRLLTIAACLVFFVGGFLTNTLLNGNAAVASNDEFSKLYEIYNTMNTKFYFGKDKENFSQTLINGAINGLVEAGGDQHTMYLDNEQTQSFNSSMEGSFVGIGIQYYEPADGIFIITRVYKDSPAEEAGLKQGDQIVAVDGEDIQDKTIDEVADMIKGSEKTTVNVEIIRDKEHLKKDVERREVLSSVYSDLNGSTGTIELYTFAETSGTEMGSHLKSLKENGCKNLILDLRDNGGGYVTAAQEIASYLLPEGTVIFKEKDRNDKITEYTVKEGYPQYSFDKIIILVNKDTASAAEILTAALQEQLNATVLGVQTYGKGTVQIPIVFKDGSMFKYTSNEWLSSMGKSINGIGITPDVEVTLDPAITTSAPKLEDEVYEADTVNIAAKSVQTYLKFLGYPVDRTDSYFSAASSEALKQYQKDEGLSVTGKINEEVVSSLVSKGSIKWHNEQEILDLQMKKAVDIINGK